ncbi:MAG: hypothetical protein ABIP75_07265 [Pyrinomonadaceae bacterium]
MIDKNCAAAVKHHAMNAITELTALLHACEGQCSAEEYESFRKGVGLSIGAVHDQLLRAIFSAYPELNHLRDLQFVEKNQNSRVSRPNSLNSKVNASMPGGIEMSRERALICRNHGLEALNEISGAVYDCQGYCTEEDFEVLKLSAGHAVGKIYSQLLAPIYSKYPEIDHRHYEDKSQLE